MSAIEREMMEDDVVIVGAGPAGLSAATGKVALDAFLNRPAPGRQDCLKTAQFCCLEDRADSQRKT